MSERRTPTRSLAEAELHKQTFTEFCRLETDTGGPDPHMDIIAEASHGQDPAERAWRAGCYIGPYVVASAAALWTHWPRNRVLCEGDQLEHWIREHWQGLLIRRERRAVKSVRKLTECMRSYACWCADETWSWNSYDEAWASVRDGVKYFGRYATIKLLETLRRSELTEATLADIRPAGAWSPRLTLSYMYPEHDAPLNRGGDGAGILELVNELAAETRDRVNRELKRPISFFKLEVLLCNYRQAIERKYPGRPHDSELGYFHKASKYWGRDTLTEMIPFFDVRARLFPHACLGEIQGWDGDRKELGMTYREHGYFWSDLTFDYARTKDLAHPVRRGR